MICHAAWSFVVDPTDSRRRSNVYSSASSICRSISSSPGSFAAAARAALELATGVADVVAPAADSWAELHPATTAAANRIIQPATSLENKFITIPSVQCATAEHSLGDLFAADGRHWAR